DYTGLATPGAHQTSYGGAYDGFIGELSADGTWFYKTYYGGIGADALLSIALGNASDVYTCGVTASPNNIASVGMPTYSGGRDGLLARMRLSYCIMPVITSVSPLPICTNSGNAVHLTTQALPGASYIWKRGS